MESESHGHVPVRRKDATPVPHAKDAEHVGGRHAHELSREEVLAWIGLKAVDENGHAVGKIEDIYAVDDTPEWVLVKHRRSHHFLAPLPGAIGGGEQVFLPYGQEMIESAPEVDPGLPASEETIAEARLHYHLG